MCAEAEILATELCRRMAAVSVAEMNVVGNQLTEALYPRIV